MKTMCNRSAQISITFEHMSLSIYLSFFPFLFFSSSRPIKCLLAGDKSAGEQKELEIEK